MTNKIPPKILLLGSKIDIGGAQRVQLGLANWLFQRGVDVTCAFFYDPSGQFSAWQEKYPFPLVCLHGWKSQGGRLIRALRLAGSWLKLIGWLRDQHISAILTFTHDSNLLGLPAAWLAGVPSRYGSHHGRFFSLSAARMCLHAFIINSRMADGLVAVSDDTRAQAILEGVQPQRIQVIMNGVEIPAIAEKRSQAIRHELKMGGKDLLVLNVGRLVAEKGQQVFIQAAARVLAVFPHVFFAIAGDGPLRGVLEEQIKMLGTGDRIRLLGSRADMPDLLAACNVFVLSSITEGLPMALLEAMAAGRAVVSTDVGGIRDAVAGGQHALLVPPGDAQGLAEAIMRLIKGTTLRKDLAAGAQARAREAFSLERMGERYLALLSGESMR